MIIKEHFLKYLKPLWKQVFSDTNSSFTISLVRTKSHNTCYINNNYTNVTKSLKIKSNLKTGQTKNTEHRKTKRLLVKRIDRKCRLI